METDVFVLVVSVAQPVVSQLFPSSCASLSFPDPDSSRVSRVLKSCCERLRLLLLLSDSGGGSSQASAPPRTLRRTEDSVRSLPAAMASPRGGGATMLQPGAAPSSDSIV